MAGITGRASGLVQLGDFFIDSQINGTVDLTSDTLIEEYIDHLMTVEFVSITNRQKPQNPSMQPTTEFNFRQLHHNTKLFPFFEIIELQNKMTSKRLKEIKDKLKFANLAKKYVALGRNSVAQNSTETAVVSGSIKLGQRRITFSEPSISSVVKEKLKLTLGTLIESPYVIIEDCTIPQSNVTFGLNLTSSFDMLVGEPSSTQSSMRIKMGINFSKENSSFGPAPKTPTLQVLVLSEVIKSCKIIPLISFNAFTPKCSYKVYIYIKKLDALIATNKTFELYCEDTVHPMGFILLSLMFILMDEVWTDEDIMKIKPYVEECGWKREQEQSGHKFGNFLKKKN